MANSNIIKITNNNMQMAHIRLLIKYLYLIKSQPLLKNQIL